MIKNKTLSLCFGWTTVNVCRAIKNQNHWHLPNPWALTKSLKDGCVEIVSRVDTDPCTQCFFPYSTWLPAVNHPIASIAHWSLIGPPEPQAQSLHLHQDASLPLCQGAPPPDDGIYERGHSTSRRSTSRTIESAEDVLAYINACSNTVPSQSC